MSDLIKVGRRVDVTAKGVQGVIAFVGKTNFAPGTWIGVVLDEPKGKNNGSLRGIEYFKVLNATFDKRYNVLMETFTSSVRITMECLLEKPKLFRLMTMGNLSKRQAMIPFLPQKLLEVVIVCKFVFF